MSFLAGRLAGKESAYFLQESKEAVTRLAQKTKPAAAKAPPSPSSSSGTSAAAENGSPADVLPEVLRHSLPNKIFFQPSDPSSLSQSSRWVLQSDWTNVSSVSPDALNPLRAYVSLPQVTFGRRRWELPQAESSITASTANDLRRDRHSHVNPEKVKAAAEGLLYVGKAFAVASALVFGGCTLIFATVASKIKLEDLDDIKTRGRELVQPKYEMVMEKVMPLKAKVENLSKKWHFQREENAKEKALVKELSKILGAKSSS